jgi:hypothetical protein
MQLVLQELGLSSSYLSQKITVGARDINVKHVRPHLYKHLAPAGTVSIQIRDASDVLIATSDAVTITDISAQNYFHGEVRFDVNAMLLKNTSYYIRLVSSGYTYGANAFIGWCQDFDLRKVGVDYTPAGSLNTPFLLELWELKRVDKGRI